MFSVVAALVAAIVAAAAGHRRTALPPEADPGQALGAEVGVGGPGPGHDPGPGPDLIDLLEGPFNGITQRPTSSAVFLFFFFVLFPPKTKVTKKNCE